MKPIIKKFIIFPLTLLLFLWLALLVVIDTFVNPMWDKIKGVALPRLVFENQGWGFLRAEGFAIRAWASIS